MTLIWVCIVCSRLSVRKFKIITSVIFLNIPPTVKLKAVTIISFILQQKIYINVHVIIMYSQTSIRAPPLGVD